MAITTYHPLDLPDSVKSPPTQSGVNANIDPPSGTRVYPVSDLMKLAPAPIQIKYQSLLTPKLAVKVGESKEEAPQDGTTQSRAAEVGTETTTEKNGQDTTELRGDSDEEIREGKIGAEDGTSGDQGPAGEGKPEDGSAAVAEEGGEKKKEKKKKRSKTKNADGTAKPKKVTPTGFEEFYTEGPIHPDIYNEEVNNIYHHDRQFSERIEAAIVRYKEKRKLNSKRGDMLSKYLSLGGIDTSIKQFQGDPDKEKQNYLLDDEFGPDYDGPTIFNVSGNMKPISSIFDNTQSAISKYYNPFAPQNWRVDWVGCAKAYLSSRAPYLFGIDDDETIDAYCEVVINFSNYVLLHSVCPEYTNDILKTQKIARLAKKELREVYTLADIFPGPLHRALSILTGGTQKDMYLFTEEAAEEKTKYSVEEGTDLYQDKCFTINKCKSVIQAAISILGTPEQILLLAELKKGDTIKVIKEEVMSYEVVGIDFPTPDQKKEFEVMHSESGPVKTMGFIHVKPWINPNGVSPEDLTPSEARAKAKAEARAEKERLDRLAKGIKEPVDNAPSESFIISSHVLEHVFMGMKFEAVVKEVVGGVRVIDELKNVYPSFYEVIENMKMLDWREPKRTGTIPPTCNDAEVEEGREDVAAD